MIQNVELQKKKEKNIRSICAEMFKNFKTNVFFFFEMVTRLIYFIKPQYYIYTSAF